MHGFSRSVRKPLLASGWRAVGQRYGLLLVLGRGYLTPNLKMSHSSCCVTRNDKCNMSISILSLPRFRVRVYGFANTLHYAMGEPSRQCGCCRVLLPDPLCNNRHGVYWTLGSAWPYRIVAMTMSLCRKAWAQLRGRGVAPPR